MKNLLKVFLIATFFIFLFVVSGFCSSSPSDEKLNISFNGSLRLRGDLADKDFDTATGPTAYYDGRMRFRLSAVTYNEDLRSTIEVETTGETGNGDTYIWGSSSSAEGSYKVGNSKRSNIKIRQAWIDYKPWTNAGITAGHMPLKIGNGVFLNHSKYGDDVLVLYGGSTNTQYALFTAKLREGDVNFSGDDANMYSILVSYSNKGSNLNGTLTYLEDNDCAGLECSNMSLINLGIKGVLDTEDVLFRGDLEIQTGKLAKEVTTGEDWNIKGHALVLGVDFKIKSSVLTFEGGLGSGDKTGDNDISSFVTSLGDHLNAPLYTFIYDYTVQSAGYVDYPKINGFTGLNSGISNTKYFKIRFKTNNKGKFNVDTQFLWLKAVRAVAINGGTADKDLGKELDLRIDYRFTKRLKYFIEGGYLFVGNAYDYPDTSADDVWRVRHGLEFSI